MVGDDLMHETHPNERAEVETRIRQIMSAAQDRDVDRLESYHLYGPKFTKFDDFEPLDRQDAETARRLEREAIAGVKAFIPTIADLKVDIFGLVAVTTFVFEYAVTTPDDEQLSLRARSTMVLVREDSEWKIVHEHFSPFKSNF